ncbi:uncharacterized protein F4822DRAFT_446021 [Hypoxylon trugodes]|uniref:uncharacterized protein n=1 Tax=Hypoxylon trugodes TaxID=326681 RepID=UPI00218E0DAB|nr:uncharacterized protein F4822DRAFT_446021 [Hypoxylon trugodes]KAI1384828.1 hypothetical protein F4822DRAFT_446021 [Hypoxylon trugodes]
MENLFEDPDQLQPLPDYYVNPWGYLRRYFENMPGPGWEVAWRWILYQRHPVAFVLRNLSAAQVNLNGGRAPFPFNLSLTWYCGAVLAIILFGTFEIDTQWLRESGFPIWLQTILSAVLAAVIESFANTFVLEVVFNVLNLIREDAVRNVGEFIQGQLATRLGWGRFHQPEDAHGDIPPPVEVRLDIVEGIDATAAVAFNFWTFTMTYPVIFEAIQYLTGSSLTQLASPLITRTELPGPNDWIPNFYRDRTIILILQIFIAAFIHLNVYLLMSRAENPTIQRRETKDKFLTLSAHLLRAVASHLLANTAHQITYMTVHEVTCALREYDRRPIDTFNLFVNHPYMKAFIPNFSPFSAWMLIGFHLLVKSSCKWIVQTAWPFWAPYIEWFSLKKLTVINYDWQRTYSVLLNRDMLIDLPGNRVWARILTTAMLGLESSWPVRMRLSTLNRVDE